eukprot:COSAG05_NODE_803_length_7215_cov_20.387858_2_plen_211_part_00
MVVRLAYLLDPNIKVTINIGCFSIVHLDVIYFKGPRWHATGFLDTDLYQKPSNMFLFMTFKSEHPYSVKRGWVTAELRRFNKRCSDSGRYFYHALNFWRQLIARGYPANFLNECFDEACVFTHPAELSKMSGDTDVEVEIPFCFITNYSFVKSKLMITDAIRDHAHLLPSSVSATRKVLAWRATPKLRNTLITYRLSDNSPVPLADAATG